MIERVSCGIRVTGQHEVVVADRRSARTCYELCPLDAFRPDWTRRLTVQLNSRPVLNSVVHRGRHDRMRPGNADRDRWNMEDRGSYCLRGSVATQFNPSCLSSAYFVYIKSRGSLRICYLTTEMIAKLKTAFCLSSYCVCMRSQWASPIVWSRAYGSTKPRLIMAKQSSCKGYYDLLRNLRAYNNNMTT